MKKYILLLFTLFLFLLETYSQVNKNGLPFIQNFTPNDYDAATQNWCIVQDKRGVMYFANSGYILEYDGNKWRSISVKNKSVVRSLAVDSMGKVYVGAVGEFGFLQPDSLGLMRYHSLSEKLDSTFSKFSNVWKTYTINNDIYFQAFENIIRYSPPKNKTEKGIFKQWKPQTAFAFSFTIRNRFFVKQHIKGLMTLENDSLILIKGSKQLGNPRIYIVGMEEKQDSIIIFTNSQGIFHFQKPKNYSDTIKIEAYESSLNKYLKKKRLGIYHAIKLPDCSFALATMRRGLIISNKDFQVKEHFGKEDGLQDGFVTYIYSTKEIGSPLWLTLNKGICRIETASPIRQWKETSGVKGMVNDIIRHKNKLYTATIQGVYYLDEKENPPIFKRIKNCPSQCWVLYNFFSAQGDTVLLTGTSSGIFQIKNNSIKPISEKYYTYSLKKYSDSLNFLYAGLRDGLSILFYDKGKWIDKGKVENINKNIRSICSDNKGNTWLGTAFSGVIKISPQFTNDELILDSNNIQYFDTIHGLPSQNWIKVHRFKKSETDTSQIIFASMKGVTRFENGKFISDSTLGERFSLNKTGIFRFKQDKNYNNWICAFRKGENWLEKLNLKNGKIESDTLSFKRLPAMTIYSVFPDSNQIVWIGGSEGIFRYDGKQKKKYNENYNSLIRKVIINNDSTIFHGTNFYISKDSIIFTQINQSEKSKHILKDTESNLLFEYSALFFEDEENTTYRFFLEGFDKNWSSWSKKKEKEYTNLQNGSYIFKVEAKNTYGKISKTASYCFLIKPPWHETWWFFTIQILIFGIMLTASVKLNRTGKSSRLTKVLTYVVVIIIFKFINMGIAPWINHISGGIPVFKIFTSLLLGLALNPMEGILTRLIKQNKEIKENTEHEENNDTNISSSENGR